MEPDSGGGGEAGEGGERMDNDGAKQSEIKLVRVSEGTFRARFFMRN